MIYLLGVANEITDDGRYILRGDDEHVICRAETVEDAKEKLYDYFDGQWYQFEYEIEDDPVPEEHFDAFFEEYFDGDEDYKKDWFSKFDKEPVMVIDDASYFLLLEGE